MPSDFQAVDYLCNTVVLWATIASLMDGGTIAFVVSMQSVVWVITEHLFQVHGLPSIGPCIIF